MQEFAVLLLVIRKAENDAVNSPINKGKRWKKRIVANPDAFCYTFDKLAFVIFLICFVAFNIVYVSCYCA